MKIVFSFVDGSLADRVGSKPLLVGGPLLTALGLAAFALPGIGGPYWATFLAPMTLTGLGMALTVVPLALGWLWANSYYELLFVGFLLGISGASFASSFSNVC